MRARKSELIKKLDWQDCGGKKAEKEGEGEREREVARGLICSIARPFFFNEAKEKKVSRTGGGEGGQSGR